MPDPTTTNYGWTKPTVGADSGSWGGLLNTDLDSIDSDLKTVSDAADAAQTDATSALTVATNALTPTISTVSASGSLGAWSADLTFTSPTPPYAFHVTGVSDASRTTITLTLSLFDIPTAGASGTLVRVPLLVDVVAGSGTTTFKIVLDVSDSSNNGGTALILNGLALNGGLSFDPISGTATYAVELFVMPA